jgi:hypothetical protein
MQLSHHQNAKKNTDKEITDISFENVAQLNIREKHTKSKLYSGGNQEEDISE